MSSPDFVEAPAWRGEADRRVRWSRIVTFSLVGATSTANYYFLALYGYPQWIIIPFVTAFFGLGYLGMSFFVIMCWGFFISRRNFEDDPYHPLNHMRDIDDDVRIAILLPVYQEEPRRVAAAIGAMWEDLRAHADAHRFDFFFLSDSRTLGAVVKEEWVTHVLTERYPDARIYYRNRASNFAAKMGNISDFLRRWGENYKYMVVLDADSIMPADALVRMARMMEGNPRAGLIQADLVMVLRKTLYARLLQFMSALTSKLTTYGSYYLYMGQGTFWGHNAIIRTGAFMKHCMLPILRKKGPWPHGKPISHDFIEAALLAGAGYDIWWLPEIDSFEEFPSNLIDDMKREIRWLNGNMSFLRVFLISRIAPLFKIRLLMAVGMYLNPVLGWTVFLMGAFGLRYVFEHPIETYILVRKYLPILAFSFVFLVFSILARLILPLIYQWKIGATHRFGGLIKLLWSYLLAFVFYLCLGPMYMAHFSQLLFLFLKGKKVHWGSQSREDRHLSWGESFRHYWWMSALGLGLIWLISVYVFSKETHTVQAVMGVSRWQLLFWYVPLLFGLTSSVWFARFTSFEFPLVERMRWFMSPQEVEPHVVVATTTRLLTEFEARVPADLTADDALKHPWFYVHHRARCAERPRKYAFWAPRLAGRSFTELTDGEKRMVLSERRLYDDFHRAAWTHPDARG